MLIFGNILVWFWYGWPLLLSTFIAAEPGWRCVVKSNSSECKVNGTVFPGDENYEHRCDISRNAWEFVDDFTSVVTEFDLVCDKALFGTIAASLVYLGSLIGCIVISTLSDKFGRKKAIFGAGFGIAIFSLLSAFPNVYWLFAVLRFLVGFGFGQGSCMFVLVSEFVGVRRRSLMGTSFFCSFPLALMALAGIAYLVRDWRILCIVTGAPAIPFVIGYWFTPESLRWLIVTGKTEQALELCKNIARVNGKEISEGELHFEENQGRRERLGDIRDLFGSRFMAKKTLIIWYSWFVNAVVYYGVFFSIPYVGGNMYLNFFLASVVELPAIPSGIWIYNRFGRKKGVFISMLLAAAGAAGSVLLTTYDEQTAEVNTGHLVGQIMLAMIWAKFWITVSFNGIYVYSAELFPTVVRNVAMGTSSAASYIGQFCSPYIIFLQRIHPILPYGIMGLNALVAGFLGMFLPETRYQPTLETVKEKEEGTGNVTLQKVTQRAS
ncbi:hypothetical protein ACROYT_G039324 [Oculina patagonica]